MASIIRSARIRGFAETFLKQWLGMLGLQCQAPLAWHQDRIREERQELEEAVTPIEKLSEESDVFFTIIRAQYDGYPIDELPPCNTAHRAAVYAYMLGKFTLRCAFYRTAAFLCNGPGSRSVREVVNPKKDEKLEAVAGRHDLDPVRFKRVGQQLRRVWPLLP